ncbi:MAG: hypothetical protein H7066_16315, partial [Cytophagaceae bacterium]|nr:hypothetical protein [Gemmatimonadaceae bacterium]
MRSFVGVVFSLSPLLAFAQAGSPRIPAEAFKALHWRTIGPEGNRFTSAAGIPGDPLTYYVGAASGGV